MDEQALNRVLDQDEQRGAEEVLATYTLQLIGTAEFVGALPITRKFPPEFLRETEENLTDLLPAGYRVEIKEWDSE